MTINDILIDGFKRAFKGQLKQNGNPVSASNPLPVDISAGSLIVSLLNQINGGASGSPLYAAGSNVTDKKHTKLVVNADCTFNVLKDNTGADLLALFNYSGQTLKAGAVILPLGGTYIAEIKIATGSVIGYGE